jgi:hypothetical protein
VLVFSRSALASLFTPRLMGNGRFRQRVWWQKRSLFRGGGSMAGRRMEELA